MHIHIDLPGEIEVKYEGVTYDSIQRCVIRQYGILKSDGEIVMREIPLEEDPIESDMSWETEYIYVIGETFNYDPHDDVIQAFERDIHRRKVLGTSYLDEIVTDAYIHDLRDAYDMALTQ